MAQILADLPNKNVWEFYTRKKWYRRERGLPNEPSLQGVTMWGGYAVSGKARKYIRLYRLRNPDKWWKEDKNGRKTIDWIERIEIFDVIGFFQSSLLKAIKNFPGLVTKEELEILKRGKADRGRVTKENVAAKMPELKVYTRQGTGKDGADDGAFTPDLRNGGPRPTDQAQEMVGSRARSQRRFSSNTWENPGTLAPSSATSKRRSRLWTRKGEDRSCGP